MELPLLLKLRKRRFTATNTQISHGGILTLKNITKKEHIQKNFEVVDKNKIIVEERANSKFKWFKIKIFVLSLKKQLKRLYHLYKYQNI